MVKLGLAPVRAPRVQPRYDSAALPNLTPTPAEYWAHSSAQCMWGEQSSIDLGSNPALTLTLLL